MIRRLLAEIEATLNVTLKRVTLREALEGKLPERLPRREKYYLSYREIKELSKIVKEEDYDKIYLPITLIRRVDLGSGIFVVPREDKRAIEILLGEKRETLSKPEVQSIASRFPSLIHIIILGSEIK